MHIGSSEDSLDDAGGTHGDGGLVDDHRVSWQNYGNLAGCGFDIAEVGVAILTFRRGHTQECKLTRLCCFLRPDDKSESIRSDPLPDEFGQACLDDGDISTPQPLDFSHVNVGTYDFMPQMRKTGSGSKTHITSADDCNSCH
jgi:hypothetical protein